MRTHLETMHDGATYDRRQCDRRQCGAGERKDAAVSLECKACGLCVECEPRAEGTHSHKDTRTQGALSEARGGEAASERPF